MTEVVDYDAKREAFGRGEASSVPFDPRDAVA